MKPIVKQIKLQSVLDVVQTTEYDWGHMEAAVSSKDACKYGNAIMSTINKMPHDLIAYVDNNLPCAAKINSIIPSVEIRDEELWGMTTVECNEVLTEDEIQQVKEYLNHQYYDDWGVKLVEKDIESIHGTIFVSFCPSDQEYTIVE